MEYKRLNIILLIDDESRRQALALAERVADDGGEAFHIDGQKYFAHITLYSPEWPEDNIPKIFVAVEKIAAEMAPFDLPVVGVTADNRYQSISFLLTERLKKLHETVVQILNQYRNGKIRDKLLQSIRAGEYSPEQVAMINDYGCPNILALYQPHLTLGGPSSEATAEKIAADLSGEQGLKTVKIVAIGITEVGPNGTAVNIVKKFDLK